MLPTQLMPQLREKLRLPTVGLVPCSLHHAASSEAFGSGPSVSNLFLMMAGRLTALVTPCQREAILVTVRNATSKQNSSRHGKR